MALGGGTFVTQNKILPGSYTNFVSAARAVTVFAERGVVAMPLELDWGAEGEVIRIENNDFYKNSTKLLGYSYDAIEMRGLRELFKHAKTLYCYRLGKSQKAANTYATAKYGGVRGNDINIVIEENIDDEDYYDVSTVVDGVTKDIQTVSAAGELTANDWVEFKGSATLAVTAGTALSGGSNANITGQDYQDFLDKIEGYSFNVLASTTTDETTKGLFDAFAKRMRDEVGVKFQCVLYRYTKADYMSTISLENSCTNTDAEESDIIYWVAGACAGCALNASLANTAYDGELDIDVSYTQKQLEDALQSGKFIFHRVNNTIRVLDDINTYVNVTEAVGAEYSDNQTVRVCDQIATDFAAIFNTRYSGVYNNVEHSRNSLKNDFVKNLQALESMGAIADFDPSDLTVSQGDEKKSVAVDLNIVVAATMTKLYMTVTVG